MCVLCNYPNVGKGQLYSTTATFNYAIDARQLNLICTWAHMKHNNCKLHRTVQGWKMITRAAQSLLFQHLASMVVLCLKKLLGIPFISPTSCRQCVCLLCIDL